MNYSYKYQFSLRIKVYNMQATGGSISTITISFKQTNDSLIKRPSLTTKATILVKVMWRLQVSTANVNIETVSHQIPPLPPPPPFHAGACDLMLCFVIKV